MFKRLIASPHTRRRVSWVIAAVLILPFIFFFHAAGQAPAPGPGGSAGTLFGKRVPWERFEEQARWARRQVEQRHGTRLEPTDPFVRELAWERLLLLEEARRRRLRVSDEELAAAIREVPVFQDARGFSPARYQQILRASGTSPQEFEAGIRQDLLIGTLMDAVRRGIDVSDEDARLAYHEQADILRGLLILIESGHVPEPPPAPTEADLLAYYHAHPEAIRIPERLSIEYAGRSREAVAADLPAPLEEEERSWYENHAGEFAGPDGTPAPFEQARDAVATRLREERLERRVTILALDLQEDREAGRPFEAIVADRGLTPATLGPIDAGDSRLADALHGALWRAASPLQVGVLSDVIESAGGVYLARVLERIPERLPPFEDVREALAARVRAERLRKVTQTFAERVRAALLTDAAAGIPAEETLARHGVRAIPAEFTRAQPIDPIGLVPILNELAFQARVGEVTDLVETPQGLACIRTTERVAADEAALDARRDTLREELLRRRQQEHVAAWVAALWQQAARQDFVGRAADAQR